MPGASAVTAAVSISGFFEKYYFYGFFPQKNKDLKEDFKILSNLNCSIIFFLPNLSKSPQSVISFPQKTTTSPEVEILKSHALYL